MTKDYSADREFWEENRIWIFLPMINFDIDQLILIQGFEPRRLLTCRALTILKKKKNETCLSMFLTK